MGLLAKSKLLKLEGYDAQKKIPNVGYNTVGLGCHRKSQPLLQASSLDHEQLKSWLYSQQLYVQNSTTCIWKLLRATQSAYQNEVEYI